MIKQPNELPRPPAPLIGVPALRNLHEPTMKRLLRRLLAIAATALTLPAAASTLTPHYTDLWWLPTESGWGVNIIQQYDTMFVTIFVYGADNQPHWFVGPAVRTVGASQSQFTGPL